MITNETFKEILKLSGLDVIKAELTKNGSYKLGSIYSAGEWFFNEKTNIATRVTCGFIGDEDKIIYEDQIILENGKLKTISSEMI